MNWRDYISVDPNIMHGVASIAGTRALAYAAELAREETIALHT